VKVNLNLARAQGFRQRHLVAWSVPTLAIAVILMLRMIVGAEANWREYRTVRASADKEAGRQMDMLTREAALHRKLDEPDNRALLNEVHFINELIDERRLSFGELTDKVTALLPAQARLAGLSMPDASGDPLVHFAIEGASEEPVETFLTNLENSPDFKDLVITNQGFEEKESGGAPVSITCSARYVGGHGALALASGNAAAPAGAEVLAAPAPKVEPAAKTPTGLGMHASVKSAAPAAPLQPGKTPASTPVIPPGTAPAVRNPVAAPLTPAPQAPVRGGAPANPPAPRPGSAQPQPN
jgi:hypothetical protein